MKMYVKSSIAAALLGLLTCMWLFFKFQELIYLAKTQETASIAISFGWIAYIPMLFAFLGISFTFLGFIKKQKYSYIGLISNALLFLVSFVFLGRFGVLII